MDKKYICILVICLSLTMFLITGCKTNKGPSTDEFFSFDVEEVIKLIGENRSEINPYDYLLLSIEETEVMRNTINEDGKEDDSASSIIYRVYLANNTEETINIDLVVYPHEELSGNMELNEYFFPRGKYTELGPGQKINIGHGSTMKHIDTMTIIEKKLLEDFKDIIYLEFLINGKKAYEKIELERTSTPNK
jgi:hypothetical protein